MFPHSVTVGIDIATVHCTCLFCKIDVDLNLNIDKYISWQTGSKIQDLFPELTPDQREILISSICGSCFDNLPDE